MWGKVCEHMEGDSGGNVHLSSTHRGFHACEIMQLYFPIIRVPPSITHPCHNRDHDRFFIITTAITTITTTTIRETLLCTCCMHMLVLHKS